MSLSLLWPGRPFQHLDPLQEPVYQPETSRQPLRVTARESLWQRLQLWRLGDPVAAYLHGRRVSHGDGRSSWMPLLMRIFSGQGHLW